MRVRGADRMRNLEYESHVPVSLCPALCCVCSYSREHTTTFSVHRVPFYVAPEKQAAEVEVRQIYRRSCACSDDTLCWAAQNGNACTEESNSDEKEFQKKL